MYNTTLEFRKKVIPQKLPNLKKTSSIGTIQFYKNLIFVFGHPAFPHAAGNFAMFQISSIIL